MSPSSCLATSLTSTLRKHDQFTLRQNFHGLRSVRIGYLASLDCCWLDLVMAAYWQAQGVFVDRPTGLKRLAKS